MSDSCCNGLNICSLQPRRMKRHHRQADRGEDVEKDNLDKGEIRKLFDFTEEELAKLGDSSMKEKSLLIEILQLLQPNSL